MVISKLIVEKFNGNIDFISKFKEGSTFSYSIQIEPLSDLDILTYQKQLDNTKVPKRHKTSISLNPLGLDNLQKKGESSQKLNTDNLNILETILYY